MKIEAFTVDNVPLIKEGDDLAEIICKRTELEDNDIIVIASTIVAKAEGLFFKLDDIVPGEHAVSIAQKSGKDPRFVQAVIDRSKECFVEHPVMLVQTKGEHVCINAGIDDSNVEGDYMIDLPEDADASAKDIGDRIKEITGKKVSIIITDTNGRAFKIGQTGVAIGVSNIAPIKNWIGEKDLFGKSLEITEEAVADEIAGAANLLMGEGDGGYPIIVVRGLNAYKEEETTVKEMYRPDKEDIIKKGLRCLRDSRST